MDISGWVYQGNDLILWALDSGCLFWGGGENDLEKDVNNNTGIMNSGF